mmetsp:Transcript_12081/g.28370  ORF Transcript_12081/g.28370 Transcript_12081/m.28370 type:complete len:235 (+) Transcript_12081:29-733(+)
MKIVVKNVSGNPYSLEVEPTDTVISVKEKLESEHAWQGPTSAMKLIFTGKILVDDKTLGDFGIQEGSMLVGLVSKVKPAAAAPAAAAPAPAPAAASPAPAPVASPAPAPAPAPTPAPEGAAPGDYQSAASNLVTGAARDSTVTQIMEMGFEREQVERALRAAFNNPDRCAPRFLLIHMVQGRGVSDVWDPGRSRDRRTASCRSTHRSSDRARTRTCPSSSRPCPRCPAWDRLAS